MKKKLLTYLSNDLLLILLAGWFFFSSTYSAGCCSLSFFILQTLNYLAIIAVINYVLIPQLLITKKYLWFGVSVLALLLAGVLVLEGVIEPDASITEALSWFAIEHELPFLFNAVMGFGLLKIGQSWMVKNYLTEQKDFQTPIATQFDTNEEAEKPQVNSNNFIFIKSDKSFFKVNIEDILYLKAEDDFVRVITAEKKYLQAGSLKMWEEQLPGDRFQRVHKSYVTNLEKITKIAGNRILIHNEEIPIGRAYKAGFLTSIEKNTISK